MLSRIWFFVTPRTVAHQAPLSMEFSRQEYWSGFPFHSPGDLPPRDQSCISCVSYSVRQSLYHYAIWEGLLYIVLAYKRFFKVIQCNHKTHAQVSLIDSYKCHLSPSFLSQSQKIHSTSNHKDNNNLRLWADSLIGVFFFIFKGRVLFGKEWGQQFCSVKRLRGLNMLWGMRKSCLYQSVFPKGCVLRVKILFSLFIYVVERQIIPMVQNLKKKKDLQWKVSLSPAPFSQSLSFSLKRHSPLSSFIGILPVPLHKQPCQWIQGFICRAFPASRAHPHWEHLLSWSQQTAQLRGETCWLPSHVSPSQHSSRVLRHLMRFGVSATSCFSPFHTLRKIWTQMSHRYVVVKPK